MAPLTKRKYAKARQGERRAHMKLEKPPLDVCPQCHSAKLAHHACTTCGTYKGREVLKIKTPKKAT